jgi:hypothetical protein
MDKRSFPLRFRLYCAICLRLPYQYNIALRWKCVSRGLQSSRIARCKDNEEKVQKLALGYHLLKTANQRCIAISMRNEKMNVILWMLGWRFTVYSLVTWMVFLASVNWNNNFLQWEKSNFHLFVPHNYRRRRTMSSIYHHPSQCSPVTIAII